MNRRKFIAAAVALTASAALPATAEATSRFEGLEGDALIKELNSWYIELIKGQHGWHPDKIYVGEKVYAELWRCYTKSLGGEPKYKPVSIGFNPGTATIHGSIMLVRNPYLPAWAVATKQNDTVEGE